MRYPLFLRHILFFSIPLLAGAETAKRATFTMDEVAKHSSKSDCWMVIGNKVYDVTTYIDDHPTPPQVLIEACGKEATEGWKTKGKKGKPHSRKAEILLKKYLVGDLARQAK